MLEGHPWYIDDKTLIFFRYAAAEPLIDDRLVRFDRADHRQVSGIGSMDDHQFARPGIDARQGGDVDLMGDQEKRLFQVLPGKPFR